MNVYQQFIRQGGIYLRKWLIASMFVFAGLGLIGAPASASVTFLLTNYNFENGLNGWTSVNGTDPGQTIEVVYDDVELSNVLHLKDSNIQHDSKLTQEIDNIDPNKTYYMPFKAKLQSGSPRIVINQLDAGGSTVKTDTLNGFLNTKWQAYAKLLGPQGSGADIILNENTAKLSVELYAQDAPSVENEGEIYYDNIKLYELKIPEVGTKLDNGSFENDLTYWSVTGENDPGQTVEISTTDVEAGQKSLHLVDTDSTKTNNLKQTFSVNTAVQYELNFYAKQVSGTPFIAVRELDQGGSLLHKTTIYPNFTSWTHYVKTFGPAGSGSDYTFQSGTTQVQITVNAGDSTTSTNEVFYDKIKFNIVRQTKAIANKDYFASEFPKVLQFRTAELSLLTRNNFDNYEDWEQFNKQFNAVISKELNEIGDNNEQIVKPFVDQFILEHPEKIVIDQFSGRGRNSASIDFAKYFPGDWLYFQGTHNSAAISSSATTISVDDSTLFSLDLHHFTGVNSDIAIVPILTGGSLDWVNAEQVKLIGKDDVNHTITVERGQYGTTARTFDAAKAYIAPHVDDGVTKEGNLIWAYNLSIDAPQDAQGKQLIDVLSDEIAGLLATGGDLEYYDGIEFDVLFSQMSFNEDMATIDSDGDGIGDGGFSSTGENRYGLGTHQFGLLLRQKIGASKLLLGDGSRFDNQRNFDNFNGMENEGFPHSKDLYADDWSDGINRNAFWLANHYNPGFTYYVNKYREDIVPINLIRLTLAAGPLLNIPVAMSTWPTDSITTDASPYELWDELVKGASHQFGWLGQPAADTVHTAKNTSDVLNGDGVAVNTTFLNKFSGSGMSFVKDGSAMKVTSNGSPMIFTLNNVALTGPDMTMFATIHGDAVTGRPAGEGRLMTVTVKKDDGTVIKDMGTFLNQTDFEADFYAKGIDVTNVDIEFEVEGTEPLWISGLTIHEAPDTVYREFDNGVVFANPSDQSYSFNLASLFPGLSFHKISGTSAQDPTTNDGSALGSTLSIPSLDGLFIVKD
jgi:hypothetical protein